MPPAPVLVICAVVAMGYYVGKPIVHGVTKASHSICRVATFGKKCHPPKPEPQKQN